MTTNQIAYWNLKESQRANQARENENVRSNMARETETKRHNTTNELIDAVEAGTKIADTILKPITGGSSNPKRSKGTTGRSTTITNSDPWKELFGGK